MFRDNQNHATCDATTSRIQNSEFYFSEFISWFANETNELCFHACKIVSLFAILYIYIYFFYFIFINLLRWRLIDFAGNVLPIPPAI